MVVDYQMYAAVLYACDRIAEGCTPTEACRRANISYAQFDHACKNAVELGMAHDVAAQRGSDVLADLLVHIFDPNYPTVYEPDPQKARIKSENIKWLLSRRFNKRYGDRMEITAEITVSHVITSQLDAAKQRLLAAASEQILDDVTYKLVPPPPPQKAVN